MAYNGPRLGKDCEDVRLPKSRLLAIDSYDIGLPRHSMLTSSNQGFRLRHVALGGDSNAM